MRRPGDWMRMPDPYLLEYISEEGPTSPAGFVSEDGAALPFSRGYVNTRCQELEEKRFLVNIGNGMYQITDRGEEWLAGEFDARALDDSGKATA